MPVYQFSCDFPVKYINIISKSDTCRVLDSNICINAIEMVGPSVPISSRKMKQLFFVIDVIKIDGSF